MTRQKNRFLTFICSLIPGAGELYMGFKKQGVSTMGVCGGIFALAYVTGFGWLCVALPILWAYSFFNVHHLKSMPEEDFRLQKDEYILRLDYVLEHKRELMIKYRAVIAGVLILMGLSVAWDAFGSVFYHLIPIHWEGSFYAIGGIMRNAVAAVVCLGGGIYLALNKEKWQNFWGNK